MKDFPSHLISDTMIQAIYAALNILVAFFLWGHFVSENRPGDELLVAQLFNLLAVPAALGFISCIRRTGVVDRSLRDAVVESRWLQIGPYIAALLLALGAVSYFLALDSLMENPETGLLALDPDNLGGDWRGLILGWILMTLGMAIYTVNTGHAAHLYYGTGRKTSYSVFLILLIVGGAFLAEVTTPGIGGALIIAGTVLPLAGLWYLRGVVAYNYRKEKPRGPKRGDFQEALWRLVKREEREAEQEEDN